MTLKKRIFLDASAWICLLEDFPTAERVDAILRKEGEKCTSLINFYEVLLWYQHRKPQLMEHVAGQIKTHTILVSMNEDVVHRALKLKSRHPAFSMADALSFATALAHDAEFVTADSDFEKVPGALYFKS